MSYLAELEKDLLNPQKPSKDFMKPQTRTTNPLSEIYIDKADPPTLSKDEETVLNHIYKFYQGLFSYKNCNN